MQEGIMHSADSALFLDRDGVINRLLVGDYVKELSEFEILPGVCESLNVLASVYSHIFIVTNQQGIGKGLMSEQQLHQIHEYLLNQITAAGGRIDKIYFCPALKSAHSFYRKPSVGMAVQARRDFPEIRLKRSVMVGDSWSDMLFGRRAGMQTVLIADSQSKPREHPHLADYCFASLADFASAVSGTL